MVAAGMAERYNQGVPRENTKRKKEPGKYDPDMVMEENIMKKITRRSFLAVCGAAAAAAAGQAGGMY